MTWKRISLFPRKKNPRKNPLLFLLHIFFVFLLPKSLASPEPFCNEWPLLPVCTTAATAAVAAGCGSFGRLTAIKKLDLCQSKEWKYATAVCSVVGMGNHRVSHVMPSWTDNRYWKSYLWNHEQEKSYFLQHNHLCFRAHGQQTSLIKGP